MFQFLKIFKKLKAASKLKKLWQNYTKVAGLESNAVKSQKLIEFLKNLELQFRRMSPKDLQHIFQNFQEFMEVIQQVIKQAALENDEDGEQGVQHELSSFLNSILVTAEKVVNNPKYRADFQKSSGILKNIVSLLERVKSHETKTIIVRIIKILSESSENQQLLGQIEGYKKLFQLIQDPDPGIRSQIIKFLKHFVDISDIEENSSQPQQKLVQKIFKIVKGVITNFSERLSKKQELEGLQGEYQENKVSSSSITQSTEQLSGLFKFNSGNPMQEFPPTITTLKEWEQAIEAHWRQIANFNFGEVQKYCYQEESQELKEEKQQTINCARLLNFVKSEPQQEVKMSPKKKSKKEEEIANKVVLDIFRLQGVLKEIITAFMDHQGTSQLELMKIIAKMLNQPENQEQFKARGGYSAVNIFFDTYRDYKQPNQQKFLSSAFNILEKIIFNSPSTETGLIQNIEAFKVLLKILLDGTNYVVVSKAFQTLQRILHMHPYNSLVLMKTKNGFERIFISLMRVLIEDDRKRAEIISQIYPFVGTNSVCFSKVGNMERSNDISQGLVLVPLSENKKLEYLQRVDEQISFMASMLNDSGNITPFRLYSFLIRKGPKYISKVAMDILTETMIKFVDDKLLRATYNRLQEGIFEVEQVNILIEDISLRFMKESIKENKESYFESSYTILCKLFFLKEQLLSSQYLQAAFHRISGDDLIHGQEENKEKEQSSQQQTEQKLTSLVLSELEKQVQASEGKYMMLAELIAKTTESHSIRLTLISSLLRLATHQQSSLMCCSVMESIFKAGKQREFHQNWIVFETNEVSLLVKQYCSSQQDNSNILNLLELIFLFTFNNYEAKERVDCFFQPQIFLDKSKGAILEFEQPEIKLLIEKALDLAIQSSFSSPKFQEYSCPIMQEARAKLKQTGLPLQKLPLIRNTSSTNRSLKYEKDLLIGPASFLEQELETNNIDTTPKLRSSFWIDYLLNLSYILPDRFSVYLVDRMIEILRDDSNRQKLMLLEKIDIFLNQYKDHQENLHIKSSYSSLIIEVLRQGVSTQDPLPLQYLLSDQNFRISISDILQKNSASLYFKVEPRANLQTYEYFQINLLPPKKLGFTIMGWVEISSRNKVNPILTLMENNLDLFELIYLFNEQERRNNRSSIESVNDEELHKKSSSVFTLQARIRQNKPMKFPISQQDFRPGYFAHIAFIASKNFRQLYLNGRQIKEEEFKGQEVKTDFIYPFKEKNMKLIIEQDQLKRYAGIAIFEGAILPYQIQRIYESGPGGSIYDFKQKSEIEVQKILFMFPRVSKWIPKIPPNVNQAEKLQVPKVIAVVQQKLKELQTLDPPKRNSLGVESPGTQKDSLYQNIEVFQTQTLKEYLSTPPSIREILKFMVLSKSVRLCQKLYFLRGLLIQNNSAYQVFVELKGIKILYQLFQEESSQGQMESTEFAYLFDILCDFSDAHRKLIVNITKQPQDRIPLINLKRKAVFQLIIDALFLVRDCDSFSKGLDFLHTLTDHPLNREVLKQLGGIKILLSLLKHICEVQFDDEESFIMKVFHKVIKIIENYFSRFCLLKQDMEFEALLGFIIANQNHVHKPKFKQSVIDLLSILSVHLLCDSQQQSYYQQKLMHFDLLAFVTTLIEFNKREITLFALKILATFLHSQTKEAKKFKTQYYKI